MTAARRGGVQATNYVLHVSDGARTLCGRVALEVNCQGKNESIGEHTCRTCSAKAGRLQHLCHWPGCKTPVPPKLWGCKAHWFRLPKPIRDRIWATYRPGQEITKDPSAAYLEAVDAAEQWIREHGGAA